MRLFGAILIILTSFIPLTAQQTSFLRSNELVLPPISINSNKPALRAYYQWNHTVIDNTVSGSLSVFIEPNTGKINLKVSSNLAKRLLTLNGDAIHRYQLSVPGEKINKKVFSLSDIPIPIFTKIKDHKALYELLTDGSGSPFRILKQDDKGPIILRYDYTDQNNLKNTFLLKRIKCKLEQESIQE